MAFVNLINFLTMEDYHIEMLEGPLDCSSVRNKGIVLIIGTRESLSSGEIGLMKSLVELAMISVMIVFEWSDKSVMDNSYGHIPEVLGNEIDSLNSLLKAFNVELCKRCLSGTFEYNSEVIRVRSGNCIADSSQLDSRVIAELKSGTGSSDSHPFVIGGVVDRSRTSNSGKIFLFGDSSCMENDIRSCRVFLKEFLDHLKTLPSSVLSLRPSAENTHCDYLIEESAPTMKSDRSDQVSISVVTVFVCLVSLLSVLVILMIRCKSSRRGTRSEVKYHNVGNNTVIYI